MKYMELKSGTDIRGIASEGVKNQTINLTDEVIKNISDSFLLWCKKRLNKEISDLRIAIGHDSRISANRISTAIKSVFSDNGVTTYDCGLASTPSMFMAVLELPCDASIQITASHHPFNRNGLKFFTKNGGLDGSDITEILTNASGPHTANKCKGEIIPCDYMKKYSANLREMIKKGVNSENYEKPLLGFKLVVDAGNGAGGFYATEVLEKLGADISGSQFLDPNGLFPNHIPNPEDNNAMQSICSATLAARADLGIIFDTDVDRSGAVGADGAEINRNSLVAIAAAIALESNEGGTIVTDSITSDGLKEYIENVLGGVHHRYMRGYKNVINEGLRLNANGINCPLSIETSGHAAMRENYFLDDGAYLVTKIIIKMANLRKEGKTLATILAPLKHALEEVELRFPINTRKFKVAGETVISELKEYAKNYKWKIAPNNHEGIRISFPAYDGWLLLRLSVHDPIMPLNIESAKNGGTIQIATKLLEFFEEGYYPDIDYGSLEDFLV